MTNRTQNPPFDFFNDTAVFTGTVPGTVEGGQVNTLVINAMQNNANGTNGAPFQTSAGASAGTARGRKKNNDGFWIVLAIILGLTTPMACFLLLTIAVFAA